MKMKKKLISCLLAISLIAGLAIPAFAAAGDISGVKFDYGTEELTVGDPATAAENSYLVAQTQGAPNDNASWITCAATQTPIGFAADATSYIYVIANTQKGSTGNAVTDYMEIEVITQAVTVASKTDATAANGVAQEDGSLTSTTTDMEYKLDGAQNWTPCTDTSVTGLAAGDYHVRLKADVAAKKVAGVVQDITISAPAQTTLTVNPTTVVRKDTKNAEFAITSLTATAVVYKAADGQAVHETTSAVIDGTKLTLTDSSALADGNYYVAAYEANKTASSVQTIEVTTQQQTATAALTFGTGADVATKAASADKSVTFTLSAAGAAGATYKVYDVATDGSAIDTAVATVSGTTLTLTGGKNAAIAADEYYITQTDGVKAESARTKVTVKDPAPPAEELIDLSKCTIAAVPAADYTGLAQTPTPVVKSGDTTLTVVTDFTFSYAKNTNAGTATLTINAVSKKSKGKKSVDFTINKVALTAPVGTVTAKQFDGKTDATVSAVTFTGLKNSEVLAVNTDITVTGAKFASANTANGIAVSGTVALIPTSAKAKNYTLASGALTTTTGNITQATAKPVSDVAETVKIGNEAVRTVDIAAHLEDVYAPWATVALNPTYAKGSPTDNNSILATGGDAPAVAADGKLTYKLVASPTDGQTATIPVNVTSTNYADFTVDVVIKVTSKDEIVIGYTGAKTVTYNGADQAIDEAKISNSVSAYTGGFTVTYDGAATLPKNAGTYAVKIVPTDTTTYMGEHTFNYIIKPATITVKADNKSITKGAALPAYTGTVTGLIGADAFTNPAYACPTADKDVVGTYPITVSGGSVSAGTATNYDITRTNGTLTVLAASAVTPPPTPSYGGGGGSYSPSDKTADVSTGTATGTEATIDSSVTNIANPVLDVKPVAANAVEVESFIKAASGFAVAGVFQINMFDSTTVVKQVEGGKVEITLPFVAPDTSKQYVVLRYNDDKTITVIPATLDGSKIIFRTDHFSTFAIAVRSDNPNLFVDTTVNQPTIPSSPTTVPATGIALLGRLF